MKVTIVSASLSRQAGGVLEVVRRTAQCLAQQSGVEIEVLGLEDNRTALDSPLWGPLQPRTFPVRGPRNFGYSPALAREMVRADADLIHTHGLWMYPSCAVLNWHRSIQRPYVVSPHGMLDPWALKNAWWKKRAAGWLFENALLKKAACLHALCESEAHAIRQFGLRNPIAIIPNGIDLPDLERIQQLEVRSQNPEAGADLCLLTSVFSSLRRERRKVLLYLGRIHPKKGLSNLLKAWAKVQKSGVRSQESEWILAIAGWDQGGHEAELKQLATELGIAWADIRDSLPSPPRLGRGQGEVSSLSSIRFPPSSILFLGPQFDDAKATCYASCDAFILPSFSEGLPMVVLEAWAYAKPVLMTLECNLPEGYAVGAALRIETTVESIAAGLAELFRLPSSDLCSLGSSGRALVAAKFAWPKIASEMKSVYDWVLDGGPKPGCVGAD